ncbi:MAG TPA: MCP four helix bundle domain-containing protein, partial [Pyrinomonadaceae bacterium]|nr:MCP four helix bundle domain-containing protein [Pyrinomonadaceae bacterium]
MFNLQNLSISRKMTLLSGVSLTALLLIGVVAIWITEKLSEDIDDLSSVQIVSMREEMQADMMHDGLRAVVFRSIIAGQTNNEADKQDCAAELKEFTESFKKSLEDLNRLPLDQITKKSVNDVFPELEKYIAKSQEITQLALSNQTDKALKEVPKFQEQFKILEDKMETLGNLIEQNSQKSRDKSAKETVYAQVTLIVGTILGFVFAVLLSYLISRSTVLRLRALAGIVNSLSAKNIEEKIDCQSKDEIGVVTCAFRDAYRYLERIAQAAEGLSHGKFDVKLEQRSEDDLLSRNFMIVTDTLQNLIKETSTLTKGAQSGDLSCRGNSQQFQGGYRELIDNINVTLDSIANPINEASEVLEKIAHRDLTPQMEGKYQGDFAKIKNSVNLAAENLKQGFEQVANSADQVAAAAEQISEGSQTLAQGAS